jgi:hypothetical protein
MMADEESKFPVSVDIGVSAKAEMKTEIPSESSGRFVDAITDIIRPFSEARGLKADLIRLQREEVAFDIARRGIERIKLAQKAAQPIPSRILVPLLEHASLTAPEDTDLIEWWARIIETASVDRHPNHVVFVDTISKLDSIHLKFLQFLANNGGRGGFDDAHLDHKPHEVRGFLSKKEGYSLNTELEAPNALETHLRSFITTKGVALCAAGFNIGGDEFYDVNGDFSVRDFPDDIISALEALNIVHREFLYSIPLGSHGYGWIDYLYLSAFGASFINSSMPSENVHASEKSAMEGN